MPDLERLAIEIATKQGGVITRQQAASVGYSRRQIGYRLGLDRWERVQSLGYRIMPALSASDHLAAAMALLPQAVVSHDSAGEIHGFPGIVEAPPIVSVHSRTTHLFPGVDVRRCHDLHDSHVVWRGGMRVTSIERTAFDLAAHYPQTRLNWMVAVLVKADTLELDVLATVLGEIGRKGKPGTAKVRALLHALEVGASGSHLEKRGRLLLEQVRCGCSPVSEYPWPWAPHRRFDDAYPVHQLAIEWDSVKFHGQRDAFETDRQRDRTAIENGWRVMRFTWRDVTESPVKLIESIQRVLSSEPCQP